MSSTATQLPPEQPPDSALAAVPQPAAAKPFTRLIAIDALRGLALVLMSLDHSAYYISANVSAEHYGDHPTSLPSWGYRILGLLTNISAPTFWLVAGISIALLARNLRRRGGGEWAVTKFLWTRAGFLLLFDATIVPLLWSKHPIPSYEYVFGLLSSFAISMLVLSGLRFLRLRYLLAISLVSLISYEWVARHVTFAMLNPFGIVLRAFTTYGNPGNAPSGLAVPYPILGWFGLMGVGYVLGKRLYTIEGRRPRTWLKIGFGLLVMWAVIRLVNGYGNQVPTGYYWNPTDLVIMYKGPVSLAYLCFNVGWGCLAFAVALRFTEHLKQRPWRWLVELGQASLFTYLAHMLVYRTFGRIELKFLPHAELLRYSTTFLIGLVWLVPLARWYAEIKHKYPKSLLQYL
jgi:uncharacterized membrane protein